MPISRFTSFSSIRSSTQALNLLRRFGERKRLQSGSFTNPTRCYHGKPNTKPAIPVLEEAPRSWRTYVIPIGVLGFAGMALFLHYNDENRAVHKGSGQGNRSVSRVQGPVFGGPFTLIDTENQIVTEQNLRGKWVLLYFGYTSSPDVGPEQVQTMAKTVDTLESKHNYKVLPVFVTIDPQRDTPSQLRAYLKEFDSRIVGLTGPVASVRQMAQEYRVYFKKVEEEGDDYLVESSHNMYLINPNMEIARCFGLEYNADELAEEIVKEMRKTLS